MKLYEITNDLRELNALAEAGELTLEMIEDTVEALDMQFDDKARGVLIVRAQQLASVGVIDAEIERLTALKKSAANSADRLTDYLKMNMLALGRDNLALDLFKVTLKKPGKMLGAIDEATLPDEYWKTVPETRKVDKVALLRAAKAETIAGVEIVESTRALIIK